MISSKYYTYFFSVVLSFFMGFIVSGIATLRSLGLSWDAVPIWFVNWMYGWAAAIPALLFVRPLTRWILRFFVEED